MTFDVTFLSAFIAGLVSFISPCVLPIVPPYLCYMAGVSIQDAGDGGEPVARRRLVQTAFVFVLGFSTVFVLLGATATAIGQLVSGYIDWLASAAGIVIIVMGLHFLGVFRISALMRDMRINVEKKPAGLLGGYLMGLAFAFGWTPCVGPVLATILFLAGGEETVARGALLLLIYSAGIGVPFVAVAFFLAPAMGVLSRHRKWLGHVEKAMGVLLVVTGILILTGGMGEIAFWLLETFPNLGTVG